MAHPTCNQRTGGACPNPADIARDEWDGSTWCASHAVWHPDETPIPLTTAGEALLARYGKAVIGQGDYRA